MGNSASSCLAPTPEHPPFSWPKDHPHRAEAIAEIRRRRRLGVRPDDLEIAEKFSVSSDTHTVPADVPSPHTTALADESAEAAVSQIAKPQNIKTVTESLPVVSKGKENAEDTPVSMMSGSADEAEAAVVATVLQSTTEERTDLKSGIASLIDKFERKSSSKSKAPSDSAIAVGSNSAQDSKTPKRIAEYSVDPMTADSVTDDDEQGGDSASLKETQISKPIDAAGENSKDRAAAEMFDVKKLDRSLPTTCGVLGAGLGSVVAASVMAAAAMESKVEQEPASKARSVAGDNSAAGKAEATLSSFDRASDISKTPAVVTADKLTVESTEAKKEMQKDGPLLTVPASSKEPDVNVVDHSKNNEKSTQNRDTVAEASLGSVAAGTVVATVAKDSKVGTETVPEAMSEACDNSAAQKVEVTPSPVDRAFDVSKRSPSDKGSKQTGVSKDLNEVKKEGPLTNAVERNETQDAGDVENKDVEKSTPLAGTSGDAGVESVQAVSVAAVTAKESNEKLGADINSTAEKEKGALSLSGLGVDVGTTAPAVKVLGLTEETKDPKETKKTTPSSTDVAASETQGVDDVSKERIAGSSMTKAAVVCAGVGSVAAASMAAVVYDKSKVDAETVSAAKSGAGETSIAVKTEAMPSPAGPAGDISKGPRAVTASELTEESKVEKGAKEGTPLSTVSAPIKTEDADVAVEGKDIEKSKPKADVVAGIGLGADISAFGTTAAAKDGTVEVEAVAQTKFEACDSAAAEKADGTPSAVDRAVDVSETSPADKVSEQTKVSKNLNDVKQESPLTSATEKSKAQDTGNIVENKNIEKLTPVGSGTVGVGPESVPAVSVRAFPAKEKKMDAEAVLEAKSGASINLAAAKVEAAPSAGPDGNVGKSAPSVDVRELAEETKDPKETKKKTLSSTGVATSETQRVDDVATKRIAESSMPNAAVVCAGVGSVSTTSVDAIGAEESKVATDTASAAKSEAGETSADEKAEATRPPAGPADDTSKIPPLVPASELTPELKDEKRGKEGIPLSTVSASIKEMDADVVIERMDIGNSKPKDDALAGTGVGPVVPASVAAAAAKDSKVEVESIAEAKLEACDSSAAEKAEGKPSAVDGAGDVSRTSPANKVSYQTRVSKDLKEVKKESPLTTMAENSLTQDTADAVAKKCVEKSTPKGGAVVGAGVESVPAVSGVAVRAQENKVEAESLLETKSGAGVKSAAEKAEAASSPAGPDGEVGESSPSVNVGELMAETKNLKDVEKGSPSSNAVQKQAADKVVEEGIVEKSMSKATVAGAGVGSVASAVGPVKAVAPEAVAEKELEAEAVSTAKIGAVEDSAPVIAEAMLSHVGPAGGIGKATPSIHDRQPTEELKVLRDTKETPSSAVEAQDVVKVVEKEVAEKPMPKLAVVGAGAAAAASLAAVAVAGKAGAAEAVSTAKSGEVESSAAEKAEAPSSPVAPASDIGKAAPEVKLCVLTEEHHDYKAVKETSFRTVSEKPHPVYDSRDGGSAVSAVGQRDGTGFTEGGESYPTIRVREAAGVAGVSVAASVVSGIAVAFGSTGEPEILPSTGIAAARPSELQVSAATSEIGPDSSSKADKFAGANQSLDTLKLPASEMTRDLGLAGMPSASPLSVRESTRSVEMGSGTVDTERASAMQTIDIADKHGEKANMPGEAGKAHDEGPREGTSTKMAMDGAKSLPSVPSVSSGPPTCAGTASVMQGIGTPRPPLKNREPEQATSSVSPVVGDRVAAVESTLRSARSHGVADPAFYEGLVDEFIEKALSNKAASDGSASTELKKQG